MIYRLEYKLVIHAIPGKAIPPITNRIFDAIKKVFEWYGMIELTLVSAEGDDRE
jgi:hypothetical protein